MEWFMKRLENFFGEAIIYNDEIYTYEWLFRKINEWHHILEEKNIDTGNIVSIEGDYSPSVIALFVALIKNNNIIVPVTSVIECEKKELYEISEAEYIIKFYSDEKWDLINTGRDKINNELMKSFIKKRRAGLVLFTSGSTGRKKALLHDMGKLLNKFSDKSHKPLRTVVFLLLDHIGGIDSLFDILCNGGTVIILKDRQTSSICEAIEKYKAELLPVSPTFLNLLLLSEEYKNYDLNSLKIISYGSEPPGDYILKKLNTIFNNVKFIQKYGLSELGTLISKSESSVSSWFKLENKKINIKIVNNELLIKSDNSMMGYLNAPSPFDEEGYFHTGDIVEIKGDYIRVRGRNSEIINVGGEKVFPSEVENILMEMPEIQDVIVYGEKNPITGNIVVATVKSKIGLSTKEMKNNIRSYCKDKLERYKIPVKISLIDELEYNLRFKKIRKM